MANFGVTDEGFIIKPLDVILAEAIDRARQFIDVNVDLTQTSPLFKILQVTAAEDAELWKRMEDLYYGNFLSTAIGENLERLGEDLGQVRRQLFATGEVRFTLSGAAPGRTYRLPQGTIVVTTAPVRAFFTTAPLILDASVTAGTVRVQAFARGPQSDVAAGSVVAVDPGYALAFLDLGPATLAVANAAAFTGGAEVEPDEDYRVRLLGFPRNLWTVQSVEEAAASADGVTDVRVFDPLGGVDVSQSYFNLFSFADRRFSSERRLGEPYFFQVVVAHVPEWPWQTLGPVQGIFEQVTARVDAVRPVSIFPLIVEADHIDIGLEATVIIRAGFDTSAVLAAIKSAVATTVATLRLGGDVLYSQVMRAFVDQTGVLDVQNLHLRRCPPAFGRITLGGVPFQTEVIEAPAGENLVMGATEIAIFQPHAELTSIQVVTR